MKKQKSKFTFRPASLIDVPELVELEKNVWGENAASRFQLISRIEIFPEGNILAFYEGKMVGYLSFEYVTNVVTKECFSWDEITDYGTIVKSHQPQEKYMYGISLSVHKTMSGQQLGFGLTLQAWINMILNNKKGIFIGSRMPGFSNYKKRYPEITPEEYIRLKRHGKLRDPELRMYEKDGVCAIKVLPEYFPDPPSENYGVLLYRKNPFYNWPFKKLWARLITCVPIKFRENLSVAKTEEI
jgi:hypothetical protein